MKITLVRHGETEENVRGIIQGQQPGHLTERGREQAFAAAGKLKGRHFDAIYCSDLQRCLDTAEPIRQAFPDVPFVIDRQLRERYGGNFEGQPLELLEPHRVSGDWYSFRLPGGGESWDDTRLRQVPFLNQLFEKYPKGSVLVISHGGPVRGIRSLLEGRSLEDIDAEGTPNAGIWEETMTGPLHG